MRWRDLLGRPFKQHGCGVDGMDCTTVAEEILKRLGMDPPASNPFREPSPSGKEMGSYFTTMEEAYQLIGTDRAAAKNEGDVVLANNEMGHPTAMFVLVDAPSGTFLTADHHGGVRGVRRWLLTDVWGVYRLKQGAGA